MLNRRSDESESTKAKVRECFELGILSYFLNCRSPDLRRIMVGEGRELRDEAISFVLVRLYLVEIDGLMEVCQWKNEHLNTRDFT